MSPPQPPELRLSHDAQRFLLTVSAEERLSIQRATEELAARADNLGDGCSGIAGFVIGYRHEPGVVLVTWIQRIGRGPLI